MRIEIDNQALHQLSGPSLRGSFPAQAVQPLVHLEDDNRRNNEPRRSLDGWRKTGGVRTVGEVLEPRRRIDNVIARCRHTSMRHLHAIIVPFDGGVYSASKASHRTHAPHRNKLNGISDNERLEL